MKYENLDLELFRLNEAGEPLALPWIEQEHLLIRKLEPIADTHRDTQIGFKLMLSKMTAFRMMYILSFNSAEHLTWEKALFKDWGPYMYESDHNEFTQDGWSTYYTEKIKCGPNEYEDRTFMDIYRPQPYGNADYSIREDHLGVHVDGIDTKEPQTISHFINDCNRAGIELIWTPYAVSKLTGETL